MVSLKCTRFLFGLKEAFVSINDAKRCFEITCVHAMSEIYAKVSQTSLSVKKTERLISVWRKTETQFKLGDNEYTANIPLFKL